MCSNRSKFEIKFIFIFPKRHNTFAILPLTKKYINTLVFKNISGRAKNNLIVINYTIVNNTFAEKCLRSLPRYRWFVLTSSKCTILSSYASMSISFIYRSFFRNYLVRSMFSDGRRKGKVSI